MDTYVQTKFIWKAWLLHIAISLVITYALLALLELLVPHSVSLFLDPIWLVFTAGILALIFLGLTSKKKK